jgi:hypothetical protein
MKTEVLLHRYVTAATNLAESVKRNIVHGKKVTGEIVAVIDDETVVKLNEFQIVANEIADLTAAIEDASIKFDN